MSDVAPPLCVQTNHPSPAAPVGDSYWHVHARQCTMSTRSRKLHHRPYPHAVGPKGCCAPCRPSPATSLDASVFATVQRPSPGRTATSMHADTWRGARSRGHAARRYAAGHMRDGAARDHRQRAPLSAWLCSRRLGLATLVASLRATLSAALPEARPTAQPALLVSPCHCECAAIYTLTAA